MSRHDFRSTTWRHICLLLLAVLTLVGCASSGSRPAVDSRPTDLTKIYVYGLKSAANLQLPSNLAYAPSMLTDSISDQLAAANWLQTSPRYHSLSLYGVILSYQDGVIDVQGEVYDDDTFLAYSRVQRHVPPDGDWRAALNLVAEQLLDELMVKLLPSPAPGLAPQPLPQPPYPYPPSSSLVHLDLCFGCWRDIDKDHKSHKPRPEPHWLPGAILKSEPRYGGVRDHFPARPKPIMEDDSSTASRGGGWGGGGSSSGGSSGSPSSESKPSSRGESGSRHHSTSQSAPGSRGGHDSSSTPSAPSSSSHHEQRGASSSSGSGGSSPSSSTTSTSSSSSSSGSSSSGHGHHSATGHSGPGSH